MTPSERYVAKLCESSFLPFWSFPNPIGKNGKELCDILVVCNDSMIIISVKDITPSSHKDESVNYDRWVKKAIYKSVDQIYGAERYLNTVEEITLKNGITKVKLPPIKSRTIYRIAVAFGSKPDYPFHTGDYGSGFVHVFDEKSTFTVLDELDTFTDFVQYLSAKEKFISNKTLLIPYEADFLAFYLQTGLELKYSPDTISLDTGLRKAYTKTKEYKDWKKDVGVSYIWDIMIRDLYRTHVTDAISDEKRQEFEEAVRYINLESRMNRIELGIVLADAINKNLSARMLRPLKDSKHTYVLMPLTNKNWEAKDGELKLRCIVARAENPDTETIIGIAIGGNSNQDRCFDICYLSISNIDSHFIEEANKIKEEFGYFKNPVISHSKDYRNNY